MTDWHDESLEERIERLECVVADMQRALSRLYDGIGQKKDRAVAEPRQDTSAPAPRPAQHVSDVSQSDISQPPFPADRSKSTKKSFKVPDVMREMEYWLNKIGIGLLLFGVAFLFKYSIDQGWITPAVRMGFGLAIAIILLAVGLRLHSSRRHFSQVLQGGGIATFYTCGFAAFQLFALVPHAVAMVFMVLVTVMAFFLSLRQNEAMLSVIGALGGLGTPFLLNTGAGTVPSLVAYTCLLLSGACAVYFYRAWRSLLWVCVVGGWLVFLTAWDRGIPSDPGEAVGDRWALQLGIIFGWLAFGVLPAIREAVAAAHPTRWPRPSLGLSEEILETSEIHFFARHVHLVSVSTPLITLALSMLIWSLPSNHIWGWMSIGGSAIYALASWYLRRWHEIRALAHTHGLIVVLLLTLALCLLLEGEVLFFSIAAEATILHLMGRRLSDNIICIFAHLVFGVLGGWLGFRLVFEAGAPMGILSARALTDLWLIATALVVARVYESPSRIIYLLVAHAAIAGWFVRELDGSTLFVALIAEAAVLRLIALRLMHAVVAVASHVGFAVLGLWLFYRLILGNGTGMPVLNCQALVDGFLVLVALGVSILSRGSEEKFVYRLCGHLAVLAWLLRELSMMSSGQAYVSIAWGVYGIILLIVGLRLNRPRLSGMAIGTLLLVVGKLFLVDLAELEAIWRILLFLSFGGCFLVVSYYFQDLWKREPEAAE